MTARALAALFAAAAFIAVSKGEAQERRNIFADPQNLQVLPEDISPDELRTRMTSFTRQLDLRCSNCHAGEEDQSIFDYDFAADDKELKSIARDMIRLMNDINQTISNLDRGADHKFVKVDCVTCHRGQRRPLMIEDVLAAAYQDGGVDAALEKYRALRDEYYGGFTFDFSALRLAEFAQSLDAASLEDALQMHNLNIELHPDSGTAYVGRAQTYEQLGKLQEAIDDFKKAIALDERYAFFQPHLNDLEKQLAGQQP